MVWVTKAQALSRRYRKLSPQSWRRKDRDPGNFVIDWQTRRYETGQREVGIIRQGSCRLQVAGLDVKERVQTSRLSSWLTLGSRVMMSCKIVRQATRIHHQSSTTRRVITLRCSDNLDGVMQYDSNVNALSCRSSDSF